MMNSNHICRKALANQESMTGKYLDHPNTKFLQFVCKRLQWIPSGVTNTISRIYSLATEHKISKIISYIHKIAISTKILFYLQHIYSMAIVAQ